MKKFYYLVLLIFVSSSCTPSPDAIQTAIALTQGAIATVTPTTDLRVIELDPEELLLREEDLPAEANYSLTDSSDVYQYSNSEVITEWGEEEGSKYIEKTGRINGWVVSYYPEDMIPVIISQNIIKFATNNGAKLALEIKPSKENVDWEILDENYDLGDLTRISKLRKMSDSGEYYFVMYRVETAFRNYKSIIDCFGIEDEFDVEYAKKIAEIAINKLEEAPLVNP